jgi:hypothetical protein
VLAIVSITGCATSRTDFVVALPNGYQIVRGKSSDPMIVKKSGGTVVPGPVASYTVIRDVVVGIVQPASNAKAASSARPAADVKPAPDGKPPSDKPAGPEKTGYFVLDTRTGELGKDLSESAYNERLESLNIAPSPELSPPVLPK